MEEYIIGPLFYAIRLVRGGPRVPCKVWYGRPSDPETSELLDRSPRWHCEANGALLDDPFQVVHLIGDQPPIVKGEEINEEEYKYMLEVKDWAVQHAPDEPEANPRRKVDLGKIKPVF